MTKLFFSNEELKNLVKELYPNMNATLGYDEEMDTDVVEFCDENGTAINAVMFSDLMVRIGERHNMTIDSFEVLEIAPLGVGFLFSF